jgi:acyl carrier protein
MQLTPDVLLTYLRNDLGVDTDGIDGATPLFSSGVIDSFALVQLISYVEDSCGIRFSAADVNLDNLDSIDRIMAYVRRAVA